MLLVPSSSKLVSGGFAAQVAGRIQRTWPALYDRVLRPILRSFRSPPRAWLADGCATLTFAHG